MKKAAIIGAYFVVFWILLPAALIVSATIVDQVLFDGVPLPAGYRIPGWILFISGLLMMLTSVVQFRYYGKEYPVSATPTNIIIRKGVFAVWRHPIYLFTVLTMAGLAMILRSKGFIFVMLPVLIIAVGWYIWFEEKSLVRRFGKAYEQHRNLVGLVIPGLHQWLKFIAFPVFKILFNIRVDQKKNIPPAPPFFVVNSHRNYLDSILISYGLPWPVKPISTYEMFRSKTHRAIFGRLGAISKKRYTHDTKSIIAIKNALDQGYPIGIAPEGERSWTGKTLTFKPETLRLFLKYKHIPILPVRIEGNYLLWPRWSPKMLRAKIRICFEEVVHVDEEMTPEELENILFEKIQPRKNIEQPIRCKSKNKIGRLSLVVYRCPVCRTLDALHEIPPGMLRCSNCGCDIEIDDRFSLTYPWKGGTAVQTIDEVYREIRIGPKDLTQAGTHPADLFIPPALSGQKLIFATDGSFFKEQDNLMVLLGSGPVYLTGTGISFLHHNELIIIEFTQLESATIESYYKLQMYVPPEKQLYQITLKKESVVKWQDMIVLIMDQSGLKKPIVR
ncbi:MAG: 1-acyl-sn-glycerol-3-phosphate acyltransferase [Bacteroidales bacterium]|jgi:1-acyl-sn-glycerol-3-phosphate acyltransferase